MREKEIRQVKELFGFRGEVSVGGVFRALAGFGWWGVLSRAVRLAGRLGLSPAVVLSPNQAAELVVRAWES